MAKGGGGEWLREKTAARRTYILYLGSCISGCTGMGDSSARAFSVHGWYSVHFPTEPLQKKYISWGKMDRINLRFVPSSFRMYLSAKVNPVSFFSTIRTFPKAPFPTTRSNRNWFRLTVAPPCGQRHEPKSKTIVVGFNGRLGNINVLSSVEHTGFPCEFPIEKVVWQQRLERVRRSNFRPHPTRA